MDRLRHSEDDFTPWIDPNDDLPSNLDIVEVITTKGYITVAQFHRGTIKLQPDGTGKITKRPCFGFINPQDLQIKVHVKAWRIITI